MSFDRKNRIRVVYLNKETVRNFFNINSRDLATKEERKNYNHFNVTRAYKIEKIEDDICANCEEEINHDWDYCPYCGEDTDLAVPYPLREFYFYFGECYKDFQYFIKDKNNFKIAEVFVLIMNK